MIKVGSLFSGVGGIEKNLTNKFKLEFLVENDKWASSVLRYHYPGVQNLGDIRLVNSIPQVDLFIGGSTCKSFSEQGTWAGMEGSSGIIIHYFRLLNLGKPANFLWENVYGAKKLGFLPGIQQAFINEGYNIDTHVFTGADHGTTQARKRVFIFGTRKDLEQIHISDSIHAQPIPSDVKNLTNKIVSYSRSTRTGHVDHRFRRDGLLHTLVTGAGCIGRNSGNYVVEEKNVRLITPEEGELLMTWAPGHTAKGIIDGKTIDIPKIERYKQIGNGVVSNMINPFIQAVENAKSNLA